MSLYNQYEEDKKKKSGLSGTTSSGKSLSAQFDEYNKKAEMKLTLGEFLVKKLALQ